MKIYLESINKKKNRLRYYEIEYRDTIVLRKWGRIGRKGREKRDCFTSPEKALAFFNRTLATRIRHQYKVKTVLAER